MRVAIFRKAHFNAAHRVFNPDWSDEKNETVFGPCANPYYHGHNYELEVKVIGDVNPQTGYVMDLKELNDLIKCEIHDKFDHKNLNEQVPEFRELIPSAENIAVVIYNKLRSHLDEKLELQVRLYETPRNFVEYPA